jgi:hypothetical protein
MKRCLASLLLLPFAIFAAETNALSKFVPPYAEVPPTLWEQHQAAIIVASFAVVAFGFLFLKVMLRPESKIPLAAETVALQALAKLQGQPENGKLLSAVSQILRRYVVAAFQLPPGEMTTAEFCLVLAQQKKLAVALGETIVRFMLECDERKFSPVSATSPCNAVDRARELISQSEAHRQITNAKPPER